MQNKEIRLARRPTGMPTYDDFAFVETEVPESREGEVLVRTLYISVDPYLRGRMRAGRSYVPPFEVNEVISSGVIGEIVESSSPAFKPGDIVTGMLGWRLYNVTKGNGLTKVDPRIQVTAALGVLGIPGLTAYFGLLDIGQPKAGETVLVSGAVPVVGRRDESVRQTPDRRGSRWGPSVPLALAAVASPALQRCRRDAVAVKNDLTRSDSFGLLLDFEIDEIAILGEFANEGIDLAQEHLRMRTALQITAYEAIFVHADVESGGAGVFDRRRSVFLDQGKHSLPARVPLANARKGQEAVKLSTERKHLTNVLKMVAYQIESDLVELIRPEYKRVEDEGRTFIQTVLQDTADIEPTADQLRITLAPLSSPHRSRVLETLCDVLNKTNTLFPGTQLRMRYSVTPSHPEAKSGHLPD